VFLHALWNYDQCTDETKVEGRGELDFVTWWRELAPLPTAYQGGHKEA
jgi:hypothetical protein